MLPFDENLTADVIENQYAKIIDKVIANTNIPIAVKLGTFYRHGSFHG